MKKAKDLFTSPNGACTMWINKLSQGLCTAEECRLGIIEELK